MVEMDQVQQFLELASDLEIKGLRPEPRKLKEPIDSRAMKKQMRSNKVKTEESVSGFEPEQQSYACHVCDKAVGNKADLIMHIETTHAESLNTDKTAGVGEHEGQSNNSYEYNV